MTDHPDMTEVHTYLISKGKKKARAHYWTGTDTVCRMWSTGGLQKSKYSVSSDGGAHEICFMCEVVSGREQPATEGERDAKAMRA